MKTTQVLAVLCIMAIAMAPVLGASSGTVSGASSGGGVTTAMSDSWGISADTKSTAGTTSASFLGADAASSGASAGGGGSGGGVYAGPCVIGIPSPCNAPEWWNRQPADPPEVCACDPIVPVEPEPTACACDPIVPVEPEPTATALVVAADGAGASAN